MSKLFDRKDDNVSQLVQSPNHWALDLWEKGCANNWMPQTIDMSQDIEQWRDKKLLTDDERLIVKRTLGLFSAGESLVSNSITDAESKYITDGACKQYMLRKAFEESLHNFTVKMCVEAYGLDVNEVAEAYRNIPTISIKEKFLSEVLDQFNESTFDIDTLEGKQLFLKNLFVIYLICEGIWFFPNFALIMALGRQNKLIGLYDQIKYTIRDECLVPGTELLTPNGWAKVEDLTKESLVAQWHECGEIDFVNPVKLSFSEHKKAYRLYNDQGHIDQTVSAKHRVPYLTKHGNLKVVEAEKAKPNPYSKHILAGELRGGDKYELSDTERLRIAIQADGSVHNYNGRDGSLCEYIRVNFDLTKERKKKRLIEILNNLGINYDVRETSDSNSVLYSVHCPPDIAEKSFCWVDLSDKTLEWCQQFIDEISEWDGHKISKNRVIYCSTDKSCIDVVQSIASLCNYRTCIGMQEDNRKYSYKNYYRLFICKHRNYVKGGSVNKVEIEYDGLMYGVEVPSGFILIRSNDSVSVTGNSLHVEFGINLINKIIVDYPEVWTKDFQEELISLMKQGVEIEKKYAEDILPNGILGVNSGMLSQYVEFLANERLSSVNLNYSFPNEKNPFPFLSETQDAESMAAFFERREKNYRNASVLEDDF